MKRFSLRLFLRYSLRTLVIAITALAVWLAAWGTSARRQAAAVRSIVDSGGKVDYEWVHEPDGSVREVPESPLRRWAGETFGEDLFRRVTYAYLTGIDTCNSDLAPVAKLTKHLEGVICEGTSVTDSGLRFIQGNNRVMCVSLRESNKITDSTLELLSSCSQLQCLYLSGTEITDAGLKHLRNLKYLRELELNDTRITDEGLKEVAHMSRLQTLMLRGTRVTDAGLGNLRKLKLRDLNMTGSEVSQSGVAELQASLPKCSISR